MAAVPVPEVVRDKPVATLAPIPPLVTGLVYYLAYRHWVPLELVPVVAIALSALVIPMIHGLVSPAKHVADVLAQGLHIDHATLGVCAAVLEQLGLQLVDTTKLPEQIKHAIVDQVNALPLIPTPAEAVTVVPARATLTPTERLTAQGEDPAAPGSGGGMSAGHPDGLIPPTP